MFFLGIFLHVYALPWMLSWFICTGYGVEDIQCHEQYSCVNETLNNSGLISCFGLGSCVGSSITNIGNGTDLKTTRCWARRACQNSPYFYGTVQYAAPIRGYLGLAWADNINTEVLDCYGEASCLRVSNINTSQVYCYGLRSCEGIIYPNNVYNSATKNIYGEALLSLQNAILYNPYQVFAHAFFSGYNTTIYCESGYECIVYCHMNGCENMNFICENGANCTVSNCSITAGIPCPNGINSSGTLIKSDIDYSYNYSIKKSIYYDTLEEISNIFTVNGYNHILNDSVYIRNIYENNECDSNYACNDFREWFSYNFNNVDKLCCFADRCCRSGVFTDINNLFCDGSESCENTVIAGIKNIHCRARQSCDSAVMNGFDKITATAWNSLQNAMISNGRYLGCLGAKSCDRANISCVDNIYSTGEYGLKNATITSNASYNNHSGEINIYLLAYYAASGMKLICSVGDVCNIYCIAENACTQIKTPECGDGGTSNCTINIIYSITPTRSPTTTSPHPTAMPSENPTDIPTHILTDNPTNIPTVVLTPIPTGAPTDIPSSESITMTPNTTTTIAIIPTAIPTKTASNDTNNSKISSDIILIVIIMVSCVCFCFGAAFLFRGEKFKLLLQSKKASNRTVVGSQDDDDQDKNMNQGSKLTGEAAPSYLAHHVYDHDRIHHTDQQLTQLDLEGKVHAQQIQETSRIAQIGSVSEGKIKKVHIDNDTDDEDNDSRYSDEEMYNNSMTVNRNNTTIGKSQSQSVVDPKYMRDQSDANSSRTKTSKRTKTKKKTKGQNVTTRKTPVGEDN